MCPRGIALWRQRLDDILDGNEPAPWPRSQFHDLGIRDRPRSRAAIVARPRDVRDAATDPRASTSFDMDRYLNTPIDVVNPQPSTSYSFNFERNSTADMADPQPSTSYSVSDETPAHDMNAMVPFGGRLRRQTLQPPNGERPFLSFSRSHGGEAYVGLTAIRNLFRAIFGRSYPIVTMFHTSEAGFVTSTSGLVSFNRVLASARSRLRPWRPFLLPHASSAPRANIALPAPDSVTEVRMNDDLPPLIFFIEQRATADAPPLQSVASTQTDDWTDSRDSEACPRRAPSLGGGLPFTGHSVSHSLEHTTPMAASALPTTVHPQVDENLSNDSQPPQPSSDRPRFCSVLVQVDLGSSCPGQSNPGDNVVLSPPRMPTPQYRAAYPAITPPEVSLANPSPAGPSPHVVSQPQATVADPRAHVHNGVAYARAGVAYPQVSAPFSRPSIVYLYNGVPDTRRYPQDRAYDSDEDEESNSD